MAICKTEAIVLKSQKLGETSKIVALYTKAFGKVRVVAKGARNPKSRFGASLESITEVFIVFYKRENRDLHTLSQADIINPFSGLKSNFEQLTYASALCELADRLAIGEGPNRILYRALRDALVEMGERAEGETEKFFWYFQLKAAGALGYRPELFRCVSCRGTIDSEGLKFSLALGGALCGRCFGRDPRALEIHLGTLRFLAALERSEVKRIGNLKVMDSLGNEIREVLRRFLEYHTGDHHRLRSLEFLKKI